MPISRSALIALVLAIPVFAVLICATIDLGTGIYNLAHDRPVSQGWIFSYR